MTDSTTNTGTGVMVPPDAGLTIRDDLVDTYTTMMLAVPEAGGEGMDNILDQLARATTVAQLDQPWRSGGLGDYRDRPIIITGMRRMPSDYTGGLGWFLVLDIVDPSTGETAVVTTGSMSVVAQLVKAWVMDAFPLAVIPRLSRKPTKDGFYPQHLDIAPRQPARDR